MCGFDSCRACVGDAMGRDAFAEKLMEFRTCRIAEPDDAQAVCEYVVHRHTPNQAFSDLLEYVVVPEDV